MDCNRGLINCHDVVVIVISQLGSKIICLSYLKSSQQMNALESFFLPSLDDDTHGQFESFT